jgi:hypothetical protein
VAVIVLFMVLCFFVPVGVSKAVGAGASVVGQISLDEGNLARDVHTDVQEALALSNGYDEDLIEGRRVRLPGGRARLTPYGNLDGYQALQSIRRSEKAFNRSMRGIDDSVRRMNTSIDRIRTYRRLFR